MCVAVCGGYRGGLLLEAHATELELHLPTLVSHSGESRPVHPLGAWASPRVLVAGVRHYDGVLLRQEVRHSPSTSPGANSLASTAGWGRGSRHWACVLLRQEVRAPPHAPSTAHAPQPPSPRRPRV